MIRSKTPLRAWTLRLAFILAAATVIPACGRYNPALHVAGVPSAPGALLATSGEAEITLVWANSGAGVTYKVKRSTTSGGPFTVIATPSGNQFTDTGLTNGTSYFYVVSAVNSIGEGPDSGEIFIVPAQSSSLAGIPTGVLSTAGDQRITLTWTASAGASSYNVYSAAALGGPYALLQNVVGTTLTSTGLTNGVTVFHHITAVNSLGESSASTPVSATPTAPPSTPGASTLTAAAGDTKVALTWTSAGLATTYTLLRGTSAGGPYGTTVASSLSGTSFTDSGLANGTPYFYVVRAVNSVGTGPNSNEAGAVPVAPSFAPGPPVGLLAAAGNGQVSLSWGTVAGATSYTILRGSVAGGPYGTTVLAGGSGTFYTETGLPNGAPVFYVVRAVNSTGTSINSNEAAATPTAPPTPPVTPTAFIAAADTTPQVVLTWNASAGAAGYTVFRGSALAGPFTYIVTTTATTFTDAAVTSNTSYYYVLRALNIGGLSAATSPASIATTPSLAPTGLAAAADNTPRVVLTWSASAGALTYNIKRSVSGGAFSQYQNVAALTYNDVTVASNTVYAYQVTAVNVGGVESLVSNTASATTPPAAPTSLTAVTDNTPRVALSWTGSTGATSYNIKRSVSGGAFVQYQTSTITSFTDPVVVNNTAYAYEITAVGIGGESLVSNTASVTTPSDAPTGLGALADNTPRVVLAWATSTGALTYNVKRSIGGGAFTQYVVAGTNAYTDTSVLDNTVYAYMVTAVNVGGVESVVSNTATATTPLPPPSITLATQNTSPLVTLTWPSVTGATSYEVWRGSTSGGELQLGGPLAAAAVSFPDVSALNNTQYFYYLITVGTAGKSRKSNEVNALTFPAAPTLLNAVSSNTPKVDLSWTAPVTGAVSYKVFRSGTVASIATVTAPLSYPDTGVTDNSTYTYSVVSTNATGDSVALVGSPVTTPPAPPSITIATQNTSPLVTLTWPSVTGATSYEVWRGSTSGGESQLGGPLAAAAVSFPDVSALNNTQYFYYLITVGTAGKSRKSNEVNALTFPAAPTLLNAVSSNTPKVDLSWTAPVTGAVSYKVFRSGTVASIATVTAPLSYPDTGVTDNSTYTYSVVSTNATGDSVALVGSPVTTPPAPPSIILAKQNTSPLVTLSWTAVGGATGYEVWRGSTSGGELQLGGPLAAAAVSFPDLSAANNTQYFYYLITVGAAGKSRKSNEVNQLTFPAAPTALIAVSSGTPKVDLSWTAPATGAVSYNVFRSGTVPSIATVTAPLSFPDTGVADNSTYTYSVIATNATGDSVALVGSPVTTPPGPSILSASAINTGKVNVSWTPVLGATSYDLYQGTGAGTETLLVSGLGTGATFYPDTSVTYNAQFFYYLVTQGLGGASRKSNEVNSIVPPTAPTGLTATATNAPQVNLLWTAPVGGVLPFTYKVFKNGSPLTSGLGATAYPDAAVADNTGYSYTVVATNAGGDSLASNTDSAFTPPAPPFLSIGVGSGSPQVTLSWPGVAGAQNYHVFRGTSSNGETQISTLLNSQSSYPDTPGNNLTEFYFVRTSNVNGPSRNSNEVSGIVPPAPPTGLGGTTSASPLQVDLSWSTPSGGAPNYQVRRSSGAGFTFVGGSTSATSLTDGTVSNGTTYTYDVFAFNAGGQSPSSTTFTISTAPVAPSSLVAVSGSNAVGLTWVGSPGTSYYQIYRRVISVSPFAPLATSLVPSYTDSGVSTAQAYDYKVTAVAPGPGGGESLASNIAGPVSPNPALPDAPILGGTFPGNGQADLSWSTPAGSPTSYNVKRSTSSGGPYTTITVAGTQTTTNLTNTGLTNGTTYYYVVSAVNASGEGVNSNEQSALPNVLPGVPGQPIVNASNNPKVTVSWTAGAGATSHEVYRGPAPIGPYTTLVGTMPMPALTLDDTTVAFNTNYRYVVRAVNNIGSSSDSLASSPVLTQPGPPTGVSAALDPAPIPLKINVNWTAPVNGATSYRVFRSDGGAPYSPVATGVIPTSYADTAIVPSTAYSYLVVASGLSGDSQNSSASGTVVTPGPPPPVPSNLTAFAGNHQVTLTWNTSPGATSYNVKRSTTSGSGYGTIGSPTTNIFSDTSAANGTIYYYVVSAVNAAAPSLDSLQASATPSEVPPTNVTASPGDGQVTLSWNFMIGAVNYNVKRSDTIGGPYTTITNTVTNGYVDSLVTNESTYYYVVSAINSVAAETSNSTVVSATPTTGPTVIARSIPNGNTVSRGASLQLQFSVPMDQSTFTSTTGGGSVTLSPPVLGAPATPILFFWSALDTVTLVFDTHAPAGIFGDDLLDPGTTYTVTLTNAIKSVPGSGGKNLSGGFTTTFTTYTQSINPTFTVDPDPNDPIPPLTDTFTLTFSKPMDTTRGDIGIEAITGYKVGASVTDTFPKKGIQSMTWDGVTNTILTVTLVNPLPANGMFRFKVSNFNGSDGSFVMSNDQTVIASAGPAGAPEVTGIIPSSAGAVSVDSTIIMGFKSPMWPRDLLVASNVVITGEDPLNPLTPIDVSGVQVDRQVVEFSGLQIVPRSAWPPNARIVVKILGTVRGANGDKIGSDQTFSFVTDAGDPSVFVLDSPFSGMAGGETDIDLNGFGTKLRFKKKTGGARVRMNRQTLAPQDVVLREHNTPFIPLKGYTLEYQSGLIFRAEGDFTGMKESTPHDLVFQGSFIDTQGSLMDTTGGVNILQFTSRSNSGNGRPNVFGGETKYSTDKDGKVTVDLNFDTDSPAGLALDLTASDGAFSYSFPTRPAGFFGSSSFNYQTQTAFEPDLTPSTSATLPGNHEMTYTLTDSNPHTVVMKEKAFIYDISNYPTPVGTVTASTTPTFTWTSIGSALGADGMAIAIIGPTGKPVYLAVLPTTATTFTLPADQALTAVPGDSYSFLLHFFHNPDGSFDDPSCEADTDAFPGFTFP